LGFNLYPQSPRYLALEQFALLRARLPALPKVAVLVLPTAATLAAAAAAGFDFFQVHFPLAAADSLAAAVVAVEPAKLWLVPRVAPGEAIPATMLARASTWMLDTYKADRFGGTGETGDWAQFRQYREMHPALTWILAGGLTPANVGAALAATGADFLDVNSGVESAPGVKDPAKLAALRAALTNASPA
jgi:phosphoribosylanthranilate isomerase